MSEPGQTEFAPVCLACGEPRIIVRQGHGKRKVSTLTCGCVSAPEPESSTVVRKRSVKNTSAKGGSEELRVCKTLRDIGFDAYKTAGSGATASRVNEAAWDTDIICRAHRGGNEVWRTKIEAKFYSKIPGLLSLVKMLSRSDMLWVRENNSTGYWFVPDATMKTILGYAREGMK